MPLANIISSAISRMARTERNTRRSADLRVPSSGGDIYCAHPQRRNPAIFILPVRSRQEIKRQENDAGFQRLKRHQHYAEDALPEGISGRGEYLPEWWKKYYQWGDAMRVITLSEFASDGGNLFFKPANHAIHRVILRRILIRPGAKYPDQGCAANRYAACQLLSGDAALITFYRLNKRARLPVVGLPTRRGDAACHARVEVINKTLQPAERIFL